MANIYDGVKDRTTILGAFTDEDKAEVVVDSLNTEVIGQIHGIDVHIIKAWVLDIDVNEKVNIPIF